MTNDEDVALRPKRAAHVVEHRGVVTVHPEPHTAPILPAGWGPLDASAQAAVLRAADAVTEGYVKLGSIWDPTIEYRVCRLANDVWGGLCVATVFVAGRLDESGSAATGRNTRLLAIAQQEEDAVRVAVDFLNWDLEAAGVAWRLEVSSQAGDRPAAAAPAAHASR